MVTNAKLNQYATGSYALLDSLRRHGVKHIFGYPGGQSYRFMTNYTGQSPLVLFSIF
jgi:thiamine pyrophosphate-dependent acetolactate synthase large subunit-like protein